MSEINAALIPVISHTVIIYLYLMLMLRFVNQRILGQLTLVDLSIIIILGSAVETAMVNADTSLRAGLTCALTLMLINRLMVLLIGRWRRVEHLVCCGPTLLIHDGYFIEETMRRLGLTREDMLSALRAREHADEKGVKYAVMEMDGTINVISK